MKIANLVLFIVLALSVAGPSFAEPELGEVALHQALLDMGTDLRLMCVAAHPDDEDGSTLAMYRKKYGYKTFALIATRGEGGQNEIGPELYEELGVIRTHEMKRASAITGAELHFLDLPEFGYSKSADETFRIWGKDEPLRRMVRKIRELKPDVIITHHGPSGGHGHHRVVGITLIQAFDAAADPTMFPEQIAEGLDAWQVARFYQRPFGGATSGANSNPVTNNTSELDQARGYTYAEMAAQALFEHKSQGMGFFVDRFLSSRSSTTYYLQNEAPNGVTGAGSVPSPGGGLFEGLKDRVEPSARKIAESVTEAFAARDAALELLSDAKLDSTRERANRLAIVAMGLKIRARVEDRELTPGQKFSLSAELFDYGEQDASSVTFTVEPADFMPMAPPEPQEVSLAKSNNARIGFDLVIPDGQAPTIPHSERLFQPHFLTPQFTVVAKVVVEGSEVELRAPVLVDIAPAVSFEFVNAPYFVAAGNSEEVRFELMLTKHSPGAQEVAVSLEAPEGFTLDSNRINVAFNQEGDQKVFPILAKIAPDLTPGDYTLKAILGEGGVVAEGVARVIDIQVPKDIRVGVVASYDDTFMSTLSRFDVPHKALEVNDFTPENLDTFSTIILDIRAYLVRPDVVANNQALLDYVHRGGTLIVNYHKTFEWKPHFAPYPIRVSRNRVTVEEAPITLLVPDHPLFTSPNKISQGDWDGWRQERGLYFPSQWDDAYTPLIDVKDPGENPPPGSCLIAPYGDGTYLYTALGWYRQLRELHPGTLRVFANMLAL